MILTSKCDQRGQESNYKNFCFSWSQSYKVSFLCDTIFKIHTSSSGETGYFLDWTYMKFLKGLQSKIRAIYFAAEEKFSSYSFIHVL